MYSSNNQRKNPLVNAHINSLLETETPALNELNDNALEFLSTIDPLYSYSEIPLKKNTYAFLDSDHSLNSPRNCVALLWDATSPFTGEKMNAFSSKVKLLKEKLSINQDVYDDFETKRSSTTWNPMIGTNNESNFPPRVDKLQFRDIGTYTHYPDRTNFDLGFLTYASIPMTSLEYNKTWQTRIEKCWTGQSSDVPEILDLVKGDTCYTRIQSLMQCYHEFFMELIRLEKDGKPLKNVYIILNPILNANDPTLKFVTNITKQVIQKYMQKSELKVNMKIILISKVQTEENSYIASEAACKYADEMVNIKKYTHLCFILFIT